MQSEGAACSFLKRGSDAAILHTIQGWVLDLSCMQLPKASSAWQGPSTVSDPSRARLRGAAIVIGFILVSRPTNRLPLRVEALDFRNGGKEKAQVTHRVVIDLRTHFNCIHRLCAPSLPYTKLGIHRLHDKKLGFPHFPWSVLHKWGHFGLAA